MDGQDGADGSGPDDSADTGSNADVSCDEVVPVVDDSMEVESTMEHPEDGTVEIVGRTHGDSQYYEFTHSDGPVTELYEVDGEFYSISDGGCVKFSTPQNTGYASLEDEFSEDEFWEEKDVVGTEAIDGTEMVVYEFTASTPYYDYDSTVYVNCETQRIHRLDQHVPAESVTTISYYTNWGSADPVSPPEMDCQEF